MILHDQHAVDRRAQGRVGMPIRALGSAASTVRDAYRHSVAAKGVSAAPVEGLRFDLMSDYLRGVVVRTEDELNGDVVLQEGLVFAADRA